jgi:transposase InsO family protein
MNQKSGPSKDAADKLVRGIKRKARKPYSAEEKIRVVLAGLRGKECIAESLYYTRSKEFLVEARTRHCFSAPAHVVIHAADAFKDKTTRPNELWQTDFTYLKVIGWGWIHLSTILDDYSRARLGLEPVAAQASPSPGSCARR